MLLLGPALLLELQPSPRRPWLVQARFFLRDQALVVVRDHLGPRRETIVREPAHGQPDLAAGDDVLQPGASVAQRPAH